MEDIFAAPKSDAARELILEKKVRYTPVEALHADRRIRIVFNENSSEEPVIANLILKYRVPVNILKADTKDVHGVARGEMILGLPADKDLQELMIAYLIERGLDVEEVDGYAES